MNLCLNDLPREVLVCHGRKEKNSESLDVYLIKFFIISGNLFFELGPDRNGPEFFPLPSSVVFRPLFYSFPVLHFWKI